MAFLGDLAYVLTRAVYADKFPEEEGAVFGLEVPHRAAVLGTWQTLCKYKFVNLVEVKEAISTNQVRELFCKDLTLSCIHI